VRKSYTAAFVEPAPSASALPAHRAWSCSTRRGKPPTGPPPSPRRSRGPHEDQRTGFSRRRAGSIRITSGPGRSSADSGTKLSSGERPWQSAVSKTRFEISGPARSLVGGRPFRIRFGASDELGGFVFVRSERDRVLATLLIFCPSRPRTRGAMPSSGSGHRVVMALGAVAVVEAAGDRPREVEVGQRPTRSTRRWRALRSRSPARRFSRGGCGDSLRGSRCYEAGDPTD
jgi:hypothetical protein